MELFIYIYIYKYMYIYIYIYTHTYPFLWASRFTGASIWKDESFRFQAVIFAV